MKRLVWIFWMTPLFCAAQLAEPIQFQDKTYDFGDVPEMEGPVKYEFTFTNRADRPITILAVQPSCGCTTPGWTKEPVGPGKTGVIKASFDPKGRPGYFNKSLTIATDFDSNPIVLQIKGNVVDRKSDKGPYDLVVENGNLRFRNSSFNVGKVFINKAASVTEFPVYNASNDTIKLLKVQSPNHLKVAMAPLPPHSRGVLKITFDARLKNQFGFVTDGFVMTTNDRKKPEKPFTFYATVEESFGALTPEEQAKAPQLVVDNYQVDMGRMRNAIAMQRTVKLRNKGKKELQLRFVQSNCSCLTVKLSKKSLKPNEETELEMTLDPTGREGLQNKAITIYSTDPMNPVQRILVKGYVNGTD
ncbi:MAG: DUF1573 domain-containing protein [Cyclobacteriaceae bacterium]|jgi:hypothetical protein